MLTRLIICLIAVTSLEAKADIDLQAIVQSVQNDNPEDQVVGKGDFRYGYYSPQAFWETVDRLRELYPNYVGPNITFGQTLLGRPLNGFFLGKNASHQESSRSKSVILINSAHHARELTSIEMVLVIFLRELANLIHSKESSKVYDSVSLLIYPIINLDGVLEVMNDFDKNNQRRKNMRKVGCADPVNDGVDINRNYDIKFDKANQETSKQCSDETHGDHPFSEPETRAVRDLINRYPSIVSALNLHAYGNLWVHPYNFVDKGEVLLMKDEQPCLFKLYDDFMKTATFPEGVEIGDAIKIVGYSAPGEATDWMAYKKNIFAWSPELGSKDIKDDDFYIQPDDQKKVVKTQYPTIRQFIDKHRVNLAIEGVENVVSRGNTSLLILKLRNKGYSKVVAGTLDVKVRTKKGMEDVSIIKPKLLSFKFEENPEEDHDSPDSDRLQPTDIDRLSTGLLILEFEDDRAYLFKKTYTDISITHLAFEVLSAMPEDDEVNFDREIALRGSMSSRTVEGRFYIGAVVIVILFFILTLGPRLVRQFCSEPPRKRRRIAEEISTTELQVSVDTLGLRRRAESDEI